MLSRVKLSQEAAAKTASAAQSAAMGCTLKQHTRLRVRAVGNLTCIAEAKGAVYKPNLPEATIEKRSISGGVVHGAFTMQGLESCQQFWVERRTYQTPKFRQRLMSVTDRLAQTLITITRPQPRALPEIAFRSMATFLKILTIVQLTETRSILMPSQLGMNVEGMVGQAKKDEADNKNNKKEPEAEGKSEEKK